MFQVDGQTDDTPTWNNGGFQGAEGSDGGGTWYIENVFEELDWPNEYFFDEVTRELYYYYNDTAGIPLSQLKFEAVEKRVLINVTASAEKPVVNASILNNVQRDTRYTYMDPHGLPSGGDWALARTGAIRVEGSENLTISGVRIEHIDGNAISINNYNRDAVVSDCEIRYIGGSAIASWGSTEQGVGGGSVPLPAGMGIDGTSGNQPRGTRIVGNIIHEIGIFQKQSSAYFQAQSCQTVISRNIIFNGPRAHINFNDQFGGGNIVEKNLLINACRETADHGPFNSWGRQPYVTKVRTGKPSIRPAISEITKNFVLANYNSQEAIDNDDASEYFSTHHNFFVYGGNGLKSDFGGHSNAHLSNVYAFVAGTCLGVNSFLKGFEDQFRFNKCIVAQSKSPALGFDCKTPPIMRNNSIFTQSGSTPNVCGKQIEHFGATISQWPPSSEIISWARGEDGIFA